MYPTCVVRHGPSRGSRLARHAPDFSRQLSGGPGFSPFTPFSAAPFPPVALGGGMFGRPHPFFDNRDHDVFVHFDDFVNRAVDALPPASQRAERHRRGPSKHSTWQPRFDLSEVENSYHLRGDLPGVETKDIEVQFTDAKTLVISGRTESHRTEGDLAQEQRGNDVIMTTAENANKAQEDTQATEKDNDAASVHSDTSSYVQPTVEDEADITAREKGTEAASTAGTPTPNNDDAFAADPEEQSSKQAEAEQPRRRYWVSERSVGTFHRTFSFPKRIDSEGVTASLKNGILDIVVPKAKAPEARKITIQ